MLEFAKENDIIRNNPCKKSVKSDIGKPSKKKEALNILLNQKEKNKVGIDRFSMHVLRHTFGTRCFEGGMKPKTIQKIMGHSNIGITMNLYVHVTEDEKFKEIELVADALKVC